MDKATRHAIDQANAKLEANINAALSLCARADAVARTVEQIRNTALALMRKRKRRPTLATVAKQVAKARLEVARYELDPDTGKIAIVTGKPETAPAADTTNKWDRMQ